MDSILIPANILGCISSSKNSQDQILSLKLSERFAYKSEDRLWYIAFCLGLILFLVAQIGKVCKGKYTQRDSQNPVSIHSSSCSGYKLRCLYVDFQMSI